MSLIHHIVLYVALVAIINVFNTPYSLVAIIPVFDIPSSPCI